MPPHPLFSDYQMSYFGGWQDMFPEVSETHVYRGATLHRGESALLPWDYEIVKDDPDEVTILLTARMQSMPFRMEKTISLKSLSTKVRIDEKIYNESPITQLEANWGQHLAFGPPFFTENAIVELGKEAVIHHPVTGQSWKWPTMYEDKHPTNLSRFPPIGTERELLYVTTPDGEYRIVSPDRGIAVKIRWDNTVWPYLWYWQNYQSDLHHPFYGCDYNIGLEMFNVPPKLTVQQAVEAGLALSVPPLSSLASWLEIDIVQLSLMNDKGGDSLDGISNAETHV
jgi:hypothetical protein